MSDNIRTPTEFAHVASDLLDTEAQAVMRIVFQAQQKYGRRANTVENLEQLRDEILTRLQGIGVLATVDPAPCFYGEPPVVEIIGKVAGTDYHKYGFDHEQKQYEVQKAAQRGEEFLGQKERANSRTTKGS